MRAAEGVVDIHVAQLGELLGEGRIVGLLFLVEAQVLQQQRLPRLQLARHLLGNLADAVGREGHVLRLVEELVQQLAQSRGHGAQAHRLHHLALGASQVRAENDLGLVAQRIFDRRQCLADARVVGDGAVLQRNIEVDADEHALVGKVEVANRELWHTDRICCFAPDGNPRMQDAPSHHPWPTRAPENSPARNTLVNLPQVLIASSERNSATKEMDAETIPTQRCLPPPKPNRSTATGEITNA